MIEVGRSARRLHRLRGGQETWISVDSAQASGPDRHGFRTLEAFREERLGPDAEFVFEAPRDLEVLTYVRQGTLILTDPSGEISVLDPAECRRSALPTGGLCRGVNGSSTETAQVFQACVVPERTLLRASAEKKRFSLADRRGLLRLLASRGGRNASLHLRQDVGIYSSILSPGQHLVHALFPGRGAWLHVVEGRLQLADLTLGTGDLATFAHEPAVSLTALNDAEILLFDLA
jgi:redox-sensitive bicupin YhaK (pirin superfamily)